MPTRVALFDLDKTLYDGFSLLDVIDAQVKDRVINKQVADSFRRSITDHGNGKISYEDMAQRQLEMYAEALEGLDYEQVFQSALAHFRQSGRFFVYARPTIELLDETHRVVLVTALPEPAAKAAAAAVGALDVYCSTYEMTDGHFTGNVKRSLTGRRGKQACAREIASAYPTGGSFAFGDSEGDIEMLRAATHAICVNPSDGLRREAVLHGWHIAAPEQVKDLVLELLGRD